VDTRMYEQARLARDARFDGRFFIGVRTTRIYCRPVCTVKSPRANNVCFFETAAAAAEAGYRPCLRCRPESAPGTPAWAGTSTTVARGLRLISEGALDQDSVEALSDRLGVTSRHLRRLFLRHLGASPMAIGQTRRLHFAKKLLDETGLPVTEIALVAGYGSVRRFNDHFLKVYARPPSEVRQVSSRPQMLAVDSGDTTSSFQLRLPYRPPYDFEGVLRFLERRAIPGVEAVRDGCYARSIRIDDESGRLLVSHEPMAHRLVCTIHLESARGLLRVVEGVRRIFDLNADPLEIADVLRRDGDLAPWIVANPGLRLPGAWDPFEILIRAIVGQQISVKGATTVMGGIARDFGENAHGMLLFPTAESLARQDPDRLPMPRARGRTVIAAARAVHEEDMDFRALDTPALLARLMAIKGIGPWTAQYFAMRALGDPDAFPDNDLVLRKIAASHLGLATAHELIDRAASWRPWRAYAAMALWSMA
jgi:AraC family transcriptional regulator, regulatory protein of adaptative response / DNA-3-methyladenine glycosylase II